ncbi:Protein dip1 [Zalerion maritima]|uniref:Protein dip1 n=1 Tax=Zalerion maritima TaxID=339359 RepID=A0AAD5RJR7_9PEZI|nr:Protein dip1 [Zalerion maritima]
MDDEIEFESGEQLWTYLSKALSAPHEAHAQIDDTLRSWLHLSAKYREAFLSPDEDTESTHEEVDICCSSLLASPLFHDKSEYVRMQIIYSLLGEDDFDPLHIITSFLLLDGRHHDETFPRMIDEGCFPKLLELIGGKWQSDARLHRLLLELLYEMSRVERLRPTDLMQVEDSFVAYLFELIECASHDVSDPYHYLVIKVLLVLNEQYMVASTTVDPTSPTSPFTNRVVKMLCLCGHQYRTFGENIILVLNRETETSLQLLILKLLYLLFTTKATYEYFYTNDLHVLLDIVLRNLCDLPDERVSLRHTYLRVLYPLLAHTQLNQPPHHKKGEIQRLISILGGSGNAHFAPADETTLRLVDRVTKVKWLSPEKKEGEDVTPSPTEVLPSVSQRFLGISLSESQAASSASIVDVVAVREKPGVKTPSRKAEKERTEKENEAEWTQPTRPKKALPEVPKHRHGALLNPPAATVIVTSPSPTKKMPPKVPPPRRRTKIRPVMPSPDPAES